MSQYTVLQAELQHELARIDRVVELVSNEASKARQSQESAHWLACGLYIHNTYMGLERIFEKVAKTIDGYIPSGKNSHKELLQQMALALERVRPPVLRPSTHDRLDEYRRFRHLIVHLYGFELDPQRIAELADRLPHAYTLVREDMAEFLSFLAACDRAL